LCEFSLACRTIDIRQTRHRPPAVACPASSTTSLCSSSARPSALTPQSRRWAHNGAKTRAAAHDALKAAATPAAVAAVPKLAAEPATPAEQPAAAPTTQMTRFRPFSEIIERELEC
jgi:hypothetical protein